MDSVEKSITNILNTTEPVYINVIESTTITPTYQNVEILWKYFFNKKISKVVLQYDLEQHLKTFPVLNNLFEAHYASKSEHLFLLYSYSEKKQIMLRYKKDKTYHFLNITSPSLLEICQNLVDKNLTKLGIIIWVN